MPEKVGQTNDVSRRQVVFGLTASAATVALAGELYLNHNEQPELEPVIESSPVSSEESTAEVIAEPEVQESRSQWFAARVHEVEVVLARDLEIVQERKKSLDEVIQKHFSVAGIESPVVRKNIELLITGVVYAESRFDSNAAPEVGDAFGPFQLTGAVWKELSLEDADKNSLKEQAVVAGKLFEQAYDHLQHTCADELQKICTVFFGGDKNLLDHYFTTPAVVGAHTAGMGDMARIITWFTTEYVPDHDSAHIVDVLKMDTRPTEYDVFFVMTSLANAVYNKRQKQEKKEGEKKKWYDRFGDKSLLYTPRVYAGYGLLARAES